MSDNLNKVWNTLRSSGYDVVDYGEFAKDMQDDGNLGRVRETLIREGYEVADFDKFKSDMFGSPAIEQEPDNNPAIEQPAVPEVSKPIAEDDNKALARMRKAQEGHTVVDDYGNEQLKGLAPAFKQSSINLAQGARNVAGEAVNELYGTSADAKEQLAEIERRKAEGLPMDFGESESVFDAYKSALNKSGITEEEKADILKQYRRTAVNAAMPMMFKMFGVRAPGTAKNTIEQEVKHRNKLNEDLQRRLDANGGDIDKVVAELEEKAGSETWGERQARQSSEAMAAALPTKGVGGFVGTMLPQMVGPAMTIGLGLATKGAAPGLVNAAGKLTLAGLSASTAGASMAEAKRYGATDDQAWAVGMADAAIETITEKIPLDLRYLKRIGAAGKANISKGLQEAIATEQGSREFAKMLNEANKKLGGKFFNAHNAKEFGLDLFTEGSSEFLAEFGETLTPIIYERPEDYPTLTEAISNGIEGFKGGLFMGGVLGGMSMGAAHKINNQRRKEQGFVDAAYVDFGKDGNEDVQIAEIVGRDETGKYIVQRGNETQAVDESQILDNARFTYDEFRRGEIEFAGDMAFDEGYRLQDPGQMAKATKRFEAYRTKVAQQLGMSEEELNEIDAANETQMSGAFYGRQAQEGEGRGEKNLTDFANRQYELYLNYVRARASYNGMISAAQDKIATQTEELNKSVDARTNPDTGTIQTVTLKPTNGQETGEQAHIVRGTLVVNPDGTINKTASGDLYVLKGEGQEPALISAGEIESADPAIDPEQEKAEGAENIANTIADQTEAAMSGRLDFNVGESFEFEDGTVGTIYGQDGDNLIVGVADEQGNVTQVPVPIKTIQDAADAKALAEANAEIDAMEFEEDHSEYRNNESVVIDLGDGEYRAATISPASYEPGMYEVLFSEATPSGETISLMSKDELDSVVRVRDGKEIKPVRQAQPVQKWEPLQPKKRVAPITPQEMAERDKIGAVDGLQFRVGDKDYKLYRILDLYRDDNGELMARVMHKDDIDELTVPFATLQQAYDDFKAPKDYKGNKLPLDADGNVDESALFESSPEAWAKWNDAEREDGGVDSEKYLRKHAAKVRATLEKLTDQYENELDFGKRRQLDGQIKEQKKALDNLNAIIENYRRQELDLNEPKTFAQYVASYLKDLYRKGELKISRADFIRETGFGYKDAQVYNFILRKKGMSINELAETIAADNELGLVPLTETGEPDTQEVRNAIIDFFRSSRNLRDIFGTTRDENLANSIETEKAYTERGEWEQKNAGRKNAVSGDILNEAARLTRLYSNKVNFITDASEVTNKDALEAIMLGEKVRGWFDTGSGEAYIYLPSMQSVKELRQVVTHEVLVHKGLRELMGEQRYTEFCKKVYNDMMTEGEREYFLQRYNGNMSEEAAGDEYLAHIAQAIDLTPAKEKSFWTKILDKVKSIFGKSEDVDLTYNNDYVAGLIRASYANMIRNVNIKESYQAMQEFVDKFNARPQEDLPEEFVDIPERIAQAEAEVNTNPTDAQEENEQLDDMPDFENVASEVVAENPSIEAEQEEEAGRIEKVAKETGADASNVFPRQNEVRFSKSGRLVGIHNIWGDKLRKAIKNGGLANPSVAVIDIDKQAHEGYGEISFILPSSMVDSRTGNNAGTWTADAYTPSYPRVIKMMSDKGNSKVWKDIDRLSDSREFRSRIKNDWDNYLVDGGRNYNSFYYWFLKESGKPIEETTYTTALPAEQRALYDGITDNGNLSVYDVMENPVKVKQAAELMKLKYGLDDEGWSYLFKEKEPAEDAKESVKAYYRKRNEEISEFGAPKPNIERFLEEVAKDVRKEGTVNEDATFTESESYVKENGLEDDFGKWLDDKEKEYGVTEKIFDGYTPSGKRRYIDNTLENVSRLMKKEGRNGSQDTYGFRSLVALLSPKETTLDGIRKRSKRLSGRDERKSFEEKWETVYNELAEKLQPERGFYYDVGEARLNEAATERDPAGYIKREYNIEVNNDFINKLNALKNAIQKEWPARYFETKFERPVYLNEFAAAVVPSDIADDLRQGIEKAGIPIYEYDKTVDGSRSKVISDIADKESAVRFSKVKIENIESMAERKYRETGEFSFSGKSKIDSAADVAFIFRELENKSTENSFVVFVKGGVPTILHVGIGDANSTVIDLTSITAGYKDFEPDRIFFVHNHPDGNVIASFADMNVCEDIQKMYPGIPVGGIVINTVTGKYGYFDKWSNSKKDMPEGTAETNFKVLSFDKSIFKPEFKQEYSGRMIASPEHVAAYISAHRLGEGSKLAALLLNSGNVITANLVTNTNYLDGNNAINLAEEIADAAIRNTASNIILIGNFDFLEDTLQKFKDRLKSVSGDKLNLLDVIQKGENGDYYSISNAEFSGRRRGVMFSKQNTDQEMFVSNAQQAVESINMGKASGEQWIKAIQGKGGLKAGEDKWLGLSQWLSEQTKPVIKDDVLGFIEENRIQIEEVHYGYSDADFDKLNDEFKQKRSEVESLYNMSEEEAQEGDLSQIITWQQLHDTPETELEQTMDDVALEELASDYNGGDDFKMAFEVIDGELAISDDDRAAFFLGDANAINYTRLQYTTPDLNNKREIALTVPTIESWKENDETHFGDADEGRAIAWARFGDTSIREKISDAEIKKEIDALGELSEWKKIDGSRFVTKHDLYIPKNHSHFSSALIDLGDKGWAVSLYDGKDYGPYQTKEEAYNSFVEKYKERISQRTKSSKVLAIDEIQSNRHQEGREKGYITKEQIELLNAHNAQATANNTAKYEAFCERMVEKYGGTREGFEYVRRMTDAEYAEWERLQSSTEGIEDSNLIPAAPFEKNWHELTFKRMLRLAAEEGYDRVAWTSGDMQADRYDLSKSVDEIRVIDAGNGEHEVRGFKDGKNIINKQTDGGEKGLAELIGKDLARKAYASLHEGDETYLVDNTYASFKGDNLKVGGQGMSGFYDEIIPRFVDKYCKKWGVKTQEIELPVGEGLWHSVEVTPEMKESVMQGQTMFSKATIDNSVTPKEVEWEGMTRFSKVTDPEIIKKFNNAKKIKGYREVVTTGNDSFEPPMANSLRNPSGGEKVTNKAFYLNEVEQSDENPGLADNNGKITLVKPDNKEVGSVDYNPYIHSRPTMVNKQFKQAWQRPNLVFVETEIADWDLDEHYKADKAKKTTGIHNWPTPSSKERLILSRYDKPVRIVPWEEVADDWVAEFGKTGVNFDIVPPALLPILTQRGVEILPPHKNMGKACNDAYDSFAEKQGTRFSKLSSSDLRNLSDEISKEQYERFAKEVYRGNEKAREDINRIASGMDWDFEKATRQYLSDLTDVWELKDYQQSIIDKARNAFGEDLSNEEVKYILWSKGDREKGVFGAADDVVMQRSLGVGDYKNNSTMFSKLGIFNKLLNKKNDGQQRIDNSGDAERVRGKNDVLLWARAVLRGDEGASESTGGNVSQSQRNREDERLLEEFAKERGVWYDDVDDYLLQKYDDMIARGEEADVYFDSEEAKAIKSKAVTYKGIKDALDAIEIHNLLFPDTELMLLGFGRDMDGQFRILLSQDFLSVIKPATEKEIESFIKSLGLKKKEGTKYTYTNGDIDVSDLHNGNVVIDSKSGRIVCIDCKAAYTEKGKRNEDNNNGEPRNLYGRRISKRLPSEVERGLYKVSRTNVIDALVSRVAEGAVPEARRSSIEGRGQIEEKKKEMRFSKSPNIVKVYHGTVGENKLGGNTIFLTTSREAAQAYADENEKQSGIKGNVVEGYINTDNFYETDAEGSKWDNVPSRWEVYSEMADYDEVFDSIAEAQEAAKKYDDSEILVYSRTDTNAIAEEAKKQGYNGVIIRNVLDSPSAGFDASIDEYIVFSPEQIMSEKELGNIRFSKAQSIYEEKNRVIDKNGEKKSSANLVRRVFQGYWDSMKALKDAQDAVAEETGKPIKDFENAYFAENAMSTVNLEEAKVYERDYVAPITEELEKLYKAGVKHESIIEYLIAKHGLERNRVMQQRAEQKLRAEWQQKIDAIPDDAKDRSQKIVELAEQYNEKIRRTHHDYAGLSALTESKSDYTALASDIVSQFEGEHETEALWRAIKRATQNTLINTYNAGLMTDEQYAEVASMYKYYIPLRGWNDGTVRDIYNYLQSSEPLREKVMKAATGRTSIADDPIAEIQKMAYDGIVSANRNRMKQKFLNMVLNHPTDLFAVSEQWYTKNAATGEWDAASPDIQENDSPVRIKLKIDAFEEKMKAAKAEGNAKKQRGKLVLGKHATSFEKREHEAHIFRNGKEYVVYVCGNPRVMQAINGLTNPNSDSNDFEKGLQTVKNFMSQAFTSKNVAFILKNLARDTMFSGFSVFAKENGAYLKQYNANYGKSLIGTAGLIRKANNGTLDESVPIERYFHEFLKGGGETGYTNAVSIDTYKKRMKEFEEKITASGMKKAKSVPKDALFAALDCIEYLNRCAEDVTRFAVYMTSRQMGRTVARSIWDAKNVTVNFNKKGSGEYGAKWCNFAYIFFNACLQSAANVTRIVKENPKKGIIGLSGMLAAGCLVPVIALMAQAMLGYGEDDDEMSYWDLPEWTRRNNLVFWIPGTNAYFTFPIAQELRPLYNIGEIAASAMFGKESVEDGIKKGAEGITTLLPIDVTGNGGDIKAQLVNFTPTAFQPVAQIVANRDFFGTPIYKGGEYNKDNPEWTKAYKGTSGWLVDGTKWLNGISGGNEVDKGLINFNPAIIEHLFESYLGGSGKTFNQFCKTISSLFSDDELLMRNVPVGSSFVQTVDERQSGSQTGREYYKLRDEYEKAQKRYSGYTAQLKREGGVRAEEYAERLSEYTKTEEFKRFWKMKRYINYIDNLNSKKKNLPQEQADALELKILELKRKMIEDMKEE